MNVINGFQNTQLHSGNGTSSAEQKADEIITDLQLVEQVFIAIEQDQLHIVPVISLTTDSQEHFAENITSEIEVEQIETLWHEALELRRTALIKRDCEFSASDLRSFCTNAQPPLESAVYCALAGFYRNLEPTAAVLSKFDYVITQFFSCKLQHNQRALRLNAEEIVVEMRRLNFEWAGDNLSIAPDKSRIRQAISSISNFSIQAKKHETLKSWLQDDFFSRSREMKRTLSETFFVPEVTTAVVICNLVIGNHFAALCEADSATLKDAASVFASDADAQEVIATHLNSSFQTLIHSGFEEDSVEIAAQERLANLFSLIDDESDNEILVAQPIPIKEVLSGDEAISFDEKSATETSGEPLESEALIVSTHDNSTADSNAFESPIKTSTDVMKADENETHNQAVSEAVQKVKDVSAIEKILKELSQTNPNKQIIKDYLLKSSNTEIRELDLEVFFDKNQEAEGKYLIKVLKLILSAEAAINLVEAGEGVLVPKFREEVHHLRDEIQIANNRLRQLMSKSPSAAQSEDKTRRDHFETLLNITNISVKAQLRLNSVVLRREKKVEKLAAEIKSNIKSEIKFEKIKYNTTNLANQKAVPRANYNSSRLLLIAATIVVLLGGGAAWFIFNSVTAETTAVSADVKSIEPKSLRGGETLIGAKINKQTLFGFVSKEWDAQTPQQKKENLRLLLGEGTKDGFEKVLLINQNGEMAGSATQTEIKVL